MPSAASARLGLTSPLSTESPDGPANIATLITQLEASVGMVKIAELAPTAGSITFSTIPQVFKGLRVRGKVRADGTLGVGTGAMSVRFNGSSALEYSTQTAQFGSTSPGAFSGTTAQAQGLLGTPTDETAGLTTVHTAFDLQVFNYSSASEQKTWLYDLLLPAVSGGGPQRVSGGGRWANVAAVTSFAVFLSSASLDASSQLALYGIV